jgi:hypothetical protein
MRVIDASVKDNLQEGGSMIFGKLFNKDEFKKYDEIFNGAIKMGQSVDNAFRQAFTAAVSDKKFSSENEAVLALYDRFNAKCMPEHKADLKKAMERYKD